MVATTPFLIAASSLISLSQALPSPLGVRAEYKNYRGDGTVDQGWPGVSDWADFETIWDAGIALSPDACRWLGLAPNTDAENRALETAVKETAKEADIDARFILAAVFQESAGCVRVKTSYSPNEGIRNPGLLQGANGEFTCNDPEAGIEMRKPCPDDVIKGMITDGVGLTTEWGFKQTIEKSKATDDSKYYKGAVLFNSGVMPESGNLGQARSNACYASDMANRVMGWAGEKSPCDRKTIGN